jgi:putative ABC transport system permease protein
MSVRWLYALRIALAELRGGTRGFRLFLACLAIGVGAIAASGSMASAFREGLAVEQRRILGGDLSLNLRQRGPSAEEAAFLSARGDWSLATDTRTMGTAGPTRRLIDLRAVDATHPLEGAVVLAPDIGLSRALAFADGQWGAAAEQALLDAFDLAVGDALALPGGVVRIRAVLVSEPDALGRGFAFSPRLMIAQAALKPLNLAQPGSIHSTSLRVKLRQGEDVQAVQAAFGKAFPQSARNLRDTSRSAEGFERALDRVELFLSCVGFAALLAGGLGVAGAVRGHLETRRTSIAILKTMGASAGDVRAAYGIQIGVLAALGAAIGLALGAAGPFLTAWVYGEALPAPIALRLFPEPLLAAGGIGLLCAFAFAALPLGAARATAPTRLFRGGGGDLGETPLAERVAAGLGLVALALVFALTSADPGMAGLLALGAGLGWAVFHGLGRLAKAVAHRAPRPGGALGLGLSALGGPGSLAPAAAPALGLGLAILAALGQIQSNLVTQVRDTAPASAPTVAYVEIPDARARDFDALIAANSGRLGPDAYVRNPILTTRLATINGVEIDPKKVAPSERWIVDNEVNATWIAAMPEGVTLSEGAWWASDRDDPFEALVSVEAEAAAGLGLKIGDVLGVLVSGREIEARVESFRDVDWAGFGANFALIFSPGPFEGAAFRHAALARMNPEQEVAVTRALGQTPGLEGVGVIRVRDALAAAADLFESLAVAIQAIAAVALAAGGAAVAGALASGARRRLYEAAILKSLGASRGRIVAAFVVEQALVGLVAAVLGAGLGLVAAFLIVTRVLEADWALDAPLILSIVGGATAAFALAGTVAGFAALSRSPARVLSAAAEFR